MLLRDKDVVKTTARSSDSITPKMKAYLRMQELRKETLNYDVSEAQREAAMDGKFGTFD